MPVWPFLPHASLCVSLGKRIKKKKILSLKVISWKTFSRVVLISFFSYNWEDPFKRYFPIEQPQSLDIIKQVNKRERENHKELCIEDDWEKWLLMQHQNNNKLLKSWTRKNARCENIGEKKRRTISEDFFSLISLSLLTNIRLVIRILNNQENR